MVQSILLSLAKVQQKLTALYYTENIKKSV